VLTVTVIGFIGMNLLAIGFGAKPRDEGKIPRYWYPVLFTIVLAGSCIYWLVFWGLQQPLKKAETADLTTGGKAAPRTVGEVVGLQVTVYDEDDDPIKKPVPAEMKNAMIQASLDGTRRRTQYKVRSVSKLCPYYYNH
jgi:hypothetical protein